MNSILDRFKLTGKVALVTGASRGLGAAIAIGLAEAGADVALVGTSSLADTEKKIIALGRKALPIKADLSDRKAIPGIMQAAQAHFGHVDILVNNAGIIRRENFDSFTEKDWDDVIGVNLDAVFFLSQLFVKDVLARKAKGKVIHVASMLSYQGGIRVASYTASKSAVNGLTKLMANELASKGINVNAIAPGYMVTDNTALLRADVDRNKAILDRIPSARWGDPEDLKGAAVFLASEASDYVHGYTLAVDGGWLAR
ncbi:MAG: 2-dehydro-3-deoxy-D-gluconate 5-dehydrogenase KduD [Verrucomicrobiota bacterium]